MQLCGGNASVSDEAEFVLDQGAWTERADDAESIAPHANDNQAWEEPSDDVRSSGILSAFDLRVSCEGLAVWYGHELRHG